MSNKKETLATKAGLHHGTKNQHTYNDTWKDLRLLHIHLVKQPACVRKVLPHSSVYISCMGESGCSVGVTSPEKINWTRKGFLIKVTTNTTKQRRGEEGGSTPQKHDIRASRKRKRRIDCVRAHAHPPSDSAGQETRSRRRNAHTAAKQRGLLYACI